MKKRTRVPKNAIPRHVKEADERGHEKVAALKAADRAKGAHISSSNAKPGDVAYVGPCEDSQRIVCYYDQNMLPKCCRTQPC
jgi:hypothetical protein